MLDVYDWDTGKYMGQIEQAEKTYNVIGNMNENQVVIGETTYGGREELWGDSTAIMDYGTQPPQTSFRSSLSSTMMPG